MLISAVNLFIPLNASLKCISIKNQECKVTKVIENNEYMTFPYSFKVNRCNGNCNNMSNPYSRLCVPDIVKNVTLKTSHLMSLKKQTKQINFQESCKCVCRLDAIICNNKQKWNKDICRCECLIYKNTVKSLES